MNLFTKADDASRRVEEFLVAANLDALDRAAFESADARRQGLAFTDGLTLTAAGAGNAAALQRQSGARKTADAARNAYKNMQDKSAAATQLLKAKAAMQQAQNTVDLARSQASIASQEQARAYDKAYQDRAFAQKSRQNDFSNQLAAQKYDLAVQKFDYQKQKYEQEKQKAYQAALASARKAVTDVRKYDKQGGYYDFDGDNVASQVERKAYEVDDKEAIYTKTATRVAAAGDMQSIQQVYTDMANALQTKLQENMLAQVQRVSDEIAAWDNYDTFNDDYAKQLFVDIGLSDDDAAKAMVDAKARCFLNHYMGLGLGQKEEDGTYSQEEFFRKSLQDIGLEPQQVDKYMDILRTSWDQYDRENVQPLKQAYDSLFQEREQQQQKIDQLNADCVKNLDEYNRKGYEEYRQAVEQLNLLQDEAYTDAWREAYNTVEFYENTFLGGHAYGYRDRLKQKYKEELKDIDGRLEALKEAYYASTQGAAYTFLEEKLKQQFGPEGLDKYLKIEGDLNDFATALVRRSSLDIAFSGTALFGQDITDASKHREQIEQTFEQLFGNSPDYDFHKMFSGYLRWRRAIQITDQIEASVFSDSDNEWVVGLSGIASNIAKLGTALPALIDRVEEAIVYHSFDQSDITDFTPYIYSRWRVWDMQLSTYTKSASERMHQQSELLGWLYDGANSLIQGAATIAIGIVGNMFVPGFGGFITAGMMAAMNFNNTYDRALENGASHKQALTAATINGSVGFLLSKFGFDNLTAMLSKQGISDVLVSSGARGLFEGCMNLGAQITNTLTDVLVLKEHSNYEQLIAQFEAEGLSRQDAQEKATFELVMQATNSFATGFVGGVVSGAAATYFQNMRIKRLSTAQAYELLAVSDGGELYPAALPDTEVAVAYQKTSMLEAETIDVSNNGKINQILYDDSAGQTVTDYGIIKKNLSQTVNFDNLKSFKKGLTSFDDVVQDYAKIYADKVNSNERWTWENFYNGKKLTSDQRTMIKSVAQKMGYIPTVDLKPGTKFVDFESADVIYKINNENVIKQLPKEMWKVSDYKQFKYLDSLLPDGKRPKGYTWHHSEIAGRMELVPYGLHRIYHHAGGRAKGYWAHAKR